MKTFIINWSHLYNLDDFYDEIEIVFLSYTDIEFWRNLDALNDIFFGWFWSFEEDEKIEIIWIYFEKSKKYIKNIDIIEEIILENKNILFIKKYIS